MKTTLRLIKNITEDFSKNEINKAEAGTKGMYHHTCLKSQRLGRTGVKLSFRHKRTIKCMNSAAVPTCTRSSQLTLYNGVERYF